MPTPNRCPSRAPRLRRWHSLILLVALVGAGLLGSGCQKMADMKKAAEEASAALEAAQNATSSEEAGKNVGTAFEKLREAVGGGKAVQAVDFRRLKPVLPETVPGLTRDDVRGERGSQMGFSTSKVSGVYTADGERRQRLTMTVTDLGSMSGLGAIQSQVNAWSASERESTDGYERSATIAGYDGRETFRTYDSGSTRGALEFLVAGRFKVEVDGRNVPMETMKAAVQSLNTGLLENLKDAGVGVDDGAGERVAEMYEEYHRAEQQNQKAGGTDSSKPRMTVAEASELQALFLDTAAGLSRTTASSTSQNFGDGLTLSQAEATYEDGDRRLDVTIIDYTDAVQSSGIVPGAEWLLFDVQRESDSGYETSTTVAGHPALESVNRRGESTECRIEMVVHKRFLVTFKGRNVSVEAVKSAIDQMRIDQLQDLGKPTV